MWRGGGGVGGMLKRKGAHTRGVIEDVYEGGKTNQTHFRNFEHPSVKCASVLNRMKQVTV